jgi:tetratricopeptide (TPR) repeat protein
LETLIPSHLSDETTLLNSYSKEDFDLAFNLAQKLKVTRPGSALPWSVEGAIYHRLGHYDLALKSKKVALSLDAKNPLSYYNLATTLQELGYPKSAAKAYLASLELKPSFSEALNNLANIRMSEGQYQVALDLYLEALRYNSSWIDAQFNLAHCYFKAGMYRQAESIFMSVGCKTPEKDNYSLLKISLGLIRCYLARGERVRAEEEFSRLAPPSVDDSKDLRVRALCLFELGWKERAFATLLGDDFLGFATHEKFSRQALQIIPNIIKSQKGAPSKKAVLVVSADYVYTKNFFQRLLSSVKEFSPSMGVHLHYMYINDDELKLLDEFSSDEYTQTLEKVCDCDKSIFATRRFQVAESLLDAFNKPLLIIDIDSEVIGSLEEFLSALNCFDAAILIREDEYVITQSIAAGVVFVNNSKLGKHFSSLLGGFLDYFESIGNTRWFIDQIALLYCYSYFKVRNSSIKIGNIRHDAIDFSREGDGYVRTFKGAVKGNIF